MPNGIRFDAPTYICALFKSVASIAAVPFEMRLVDGVISGDRGGAQHALLIVIALFLIAYLFERLSDWFELCFAHYNKYSATKAFANWLHQIPLAEAESIQTQELLKQVDEYHVKSVDLRKAINSFSELLLFFVLLLWLLRNMILVAVVLIVLIGAVLFFHYVAGNRTSGFWEKYMQNTRRYNYLSDLLSRREYAYERRVYNFSDRINGLFQDAFETARGINRRSGLLRFRYQMLTESMMICCTVFTMFYFIKPLEFGSITLGCYMAVIAVVSQIFSLLTESAQSIHSIKEHQILQARMQRFFRLPGAQDMKTKPGDTLINLQNVIFSYKGSEETIIKGISWSLEKGKRYGLVGVNGSGKTTLIKLMLGLYQPQSGTITAIGQINDLCMVVFQDFCEYPMSIREFLLLGNRAQPSDDTIYLALERLGVEKAVRSLKLQLDTPLMLLTDESIQMSKGQLQKLAVARAFLTEKQIVILDEPTASLDPISERNLYDNCYEALRNKTTLFITHRLGAIRNADEILVIDRGNLVERGTHDSLMEKNGVYYSLFATQRSLYEENK